MEKVIVDENYVKLNKRTGEIKPLTHRIKTKLEEHNKCVIVFNDFAKKASDINGIHLKLFFVMCSYVKYTNDECAIEKIMVDDKFVRFCNESGLKGDIQYFKNRMYELEKSGLIVKHLPNVYYVNPLYAFKGKLKTRNHIVYGDPKQ